MLDTIGLISRRLALCIGSLAIVLVLYAVSVGPASILLRGSDESVEVANLMYAPLVRVADRASMLSALEWYLDLWETR